VTCFASFSASLLACMSLSPRHAALQVSLQGLCERVAVAGAKLERRRACPVSWADSDSRSKLRQQARRPRWSACLTPGRYEELVTDVSDEIGRAKHRHDALGVPGRNVRADNVVGGLPLHGHNLAAVDGQDAVAETVQHPAVLETVRREAPSRSVHPSTKAEDLDLRCPARFPDSSAASKEDSLRGPSLLVEWFLVFL